jgi:hypothetical protein
MINVYGTLELGTMRAITSFTGSPVFYILFQTYLSSLLYTVELYVKDRVVKCMNTLDSYS